MDLMESELNNVDPISVKEFDILFSYATITLQMSLFILILGLAILSTAAIASSAIDSNANVSSSGY